VTESLEDPVPQVRPSGTMVTYGYRKEHLPQDLAIARWLGATRLEILPDWTARPDPIPARRECQAAGFMIHSVHACWGGVSPFQERVDLASVSPTVRSASIDAVKYCLDWSEQVGARYVVVHPGVLSVREEIEARTEALLQSLDILARSIDSSELSICVENMPPGVHPGHRMSDLLKIVQLLDRRQVGLALDTGHANISSSLKSETLAAGPWLFTTHVHDNNGRNDAHLPPGAGTIDWESWPACLDEIGYNGVILLECIRYLREHPEALNDEFLRRFSRLVNA